MLMQDSVVEPLLRRALRIPDEIRLLPTSAEKWGQCLMLCLPLGLTVRRARAQLQAIGTHEGRALVFALQVDRTIPGQHHFAPSLDFALRRLQPPRSFESLRNMGFVDFGWMQACYRLGVRGMDEMDRVARARHRRRIDGSLLLALVELGAIRSVEDLEQLPSHNDGHYGDHQPDRHDVGKFRQVVQLLLDAGAVPTSIVPLVKHPISYFDPQRLSATLAVLGLEGWELSTLLETAGRQLLLAKPERWAFLCDVLGLRAAADLGRFARLLEGGRPNRAFALALRTAGADVDALDACQSLILEVGARDDVSLPVAALQRLLASPHTFTFADLAKAKDYLLSECDLQAFLRVLVEHGYGGAEHVLAFQNCYQRFGADMLHRWLGIAGACGAGEASAAVAGWVARAGSGGYIESFDYLLQAGELRTLTHLQQTVELAPLGASLLRYVREERGVGDLSALRNWYYHDAEGIKDLRFWYELDGLHRVLLDDAFERRNFTLLEGNRDVVDRYIGERITTALGAFPFRTDEETREAYHEASRALRKELGAALVPRLRDMLVASDGLLLRSLIEHIDEPVQQLRQRIAALAPLLGDLFAGAGPSKAILSDLEADLIAIVYRTTPYTIRSHWRQVIGRERDVAGLVAGARYPMQWLRAELRLDGLMEPRDLQALSEALLFAARFAAEYRQDMHAVCRPLGAKPLQDAAADVWSLRSHLGLLLAIAGTDSNVRAWLDKGNEAIVAIAEAGSLAYQQVESLHTLFDVQLVDALDVLEAGFVEGLDDAAAGTLASRLAMRDRVGSATAKDDLRQALATARQVVLRVYRRWAARQKDRFTPQGLEGVHTQLQAIVSKAPAAFFAKEAACLCTRANTDMWQEERHAHLLVFAPSEKRLAGMALLYFERIPALDADRDTLVIRAINPVGGFLASHAVPSIVDAYFDVAIGIARDNGLAAVAFPSPHGMHLMSNHKDIEDDIGERFIKRALTYRCWKPEEESTSWLEQPRRVTAKFYAYQSGEVPVETLYAVWHARECDKAQRAVA
ncbi:hypothetical protein ACRS3X_05175 [Ectopseudomonas hydrolytica]|uniref:hypothetical protein n=1 Tax=Ectopseudomonas hydrolytica TaxID=2493633 RepID=UPI003EE0A226